MPRGLLEREHVLSTADAAIARARRGAGCLIVIDTKKRSLLLASGKHAFAAAGEGTLRLRLTKTGRRAIRRAHAIKLQIVTRFAPTQGAPVIAVKRLTVKVRRAGARPARVPAVAGAWRIEVVRR
jgi:hypothetical protein